MCQVDRLTPQSTANSSEEQSSKHARRTRVRANADKLPCLTTQLRRFTTCFEPPRISVELHILPWRRAAAPDRLVPEPGLEEIGTRFRVTIRTSPVRVNSVDNVDQAILDALSSGQGWSTQQLAATVKLSPRATRTRLLALISRGFVRELGTSPQDPKRRYFLA